MKDIIRKISQNIIKKIKLLNNYDKLFIIIIFLFSINVFIIGTLLHPIPKPNSPENDQYIIKIEKIMNKKLPKDVYRPLLYNIISSIPAKIFNDPFIGGRFISQLFSIIFIFFSYLTARKIFKNPIAILTISILILNIVVFRNSLYVATDMMFSALTTILIYLLVSLINKFSYIKIILISFIFSMTYFTRYVSVIFIPIIIVLIIMISLKDKKKIIISLLLFITLSSILLLPHFFITTINFGNPFYNENWRNLAFKLFSKADWSSFEQYNYTNFLDVITSHPKLFIISGLKNIITLLDNIGKLIFSKYLLINSLFPILLIIQIFVFILESLYKKFKLNFQEKSISVLLIFIILYGLLLSFTFFIISRLLLPILPYCIMITIYIITKFNITLNTSDKKQILKKTFIFIIVVFLVLKIGLFTKNVISFYKTHPIEEYKAAKKLQNIYGKNINVMHSTLYLDKYVEYNCIFAEIFMKYNNLNEFYKNLLIKLKKENIDYLIIGKYSITNFPKNILINKDVPDFLSLYSLDDEYVIYQVNKKIF